MCNKKTPQETHLQAKSFFHAVDSFFKEQKSGDFDIHGTKHF